MGTCNLNNRGDCFEELAASDFDFAYVIGRGGFGSVFFVCRIQLGLASEEEARQTCVRHEGLVKSQNSFKKIN